MALEKLLLRVLPLFLWIGLSVATTGCTSTLLSNPTSPPPVVDALLQGERIHEAFGSLASRATLAPDSDFRVTLVGRDEQHSHHVVTIRHAETPHRHDEHDLLVVMLKGYGEMLIGDETRSVGEGSILYVPRHTRHAFSNHSSEPATAYAIFTPPFDGKDRVADP